MKLLVAGVVVLFVGFWMVQAPESLATLTQDGAAWTWEMLTTVFDAIISYTGALFQ